MQVVDINIVAIVVAAAVAMLTGAVWYGPLFGRRWLQASGRKASDTKKEDAKTGYLGGTLVALITAFLLAHFVEFAEAATFVEGATVGVWAWFGFVVTTGLNRVLWEKGNKDLYLLNQGNYLVSFLLMGGILAVWV